MKRIRWIILLAAAAVLCLGGFSFAAAAEEKGADEWTVMIYFCGSDLESKYSYASENLKEIQTVEYPYDATSVYEIDPSVANGLRNNIGKVNILIETGGSRKWHAQDAGMNIDTAALQRWRYNYYPDVPEEDEKLHTFELMETLPLQSMADPETLTDFIRWSAKACPAKKYALVLWDHGNAAKGLFIDELFNEDILYLYELKQALAEGGVHLDTLIFDACLMANLETAWNVKDYADYMVASEEVVPGSGTAFKDWLNALVSHPSLDGRWLAQCVCDLTAVKYANMTSEKSRSLLTWSVTDLSQIDGLIHACGEYMKRMNSYLTARSPLFIMYSYLLSGEKDYGEDSQNMHDLGNALYNKVACYFVDPQILDPMIDALSKAEIYVSRGQGRSNSKGLSYCFPAAFSEEDLNIYAKNFPMPSYLAFLDAITPWTAPEEIYTKTERLPEITDVEKYQLKGEKIFTETGMPALSLTGPLLYSFYNLYKLDEATGDIILLGQTECDIEYTDNIRLTQASDPMHWPMLEGTLCCIALVQSNGSELLYNIPIQIGTDTALLRCGSTITVAENGTRKSSYTVYGIWEGYDVYSELMNRSVRSLALVAGQNYYVLYPKESTTKDGKVSFLKSEEKTMYRSLEIREGPLPAGTYYLEYELMDGFMRTTTSDRIEIKWDGKKMTFPNEASWSGSL